MKNAEVSGRRNGRTLKLADLLKREREGLGLSQGALARELGISRPYLSRLERAEYAHPSPQILARIATYLGMPLDDLYALTGCTLPTDLPAYGPYLRAKHPNWPEDVLAELEDVYEFVKKKYSLE